MQENRTTNILIVGVGGQGIILASEVLAQVCLAEGYDVKQSEVHGMAQRGGSVTSHVRFGSAVHSPVIERGTADILLSFELLEGLRWIDYLQPEGTVIVNNQRIAPVTVSTGAAHYPEDVREQIQGRCNRALVVDGDAIARGLGNARVVNVVLLGALSTQLPFKRGLWEDCIQRRVPPRTVDLNQAAFAAGAGISEQSGMSETGEAGSLK